MKQEYYFQQMKKEQKAAYRAMYDGFTALSGEFAVPRLSGAELTDIFFRLRLDHPSIFYVCGFSYRFVEQADFVHLVPDYLFDKKKIKEHQKSLEGRIARLVRPLKTLSPEEQEKAIHAFIQENVTYDKLKKQYSHEIIGPLQQGVGVCEGIAKTVKILCDELGIDCIIAISGAAPEKGIKYRHAWNVLKLNGSWYHLDATFDNSLGRYGAKRFDYYNLDDKKIFRDHEPVIYPIPACVKGDDFYYKVNRLSLTKVEDVEKRLKVVLRKKEPYFVFHWRGGALNREVLTEILESAARSAKEKEKYIKVSLNYPQSVIQLGILDSIPETEICEEEANEGETVQQ